MPLAIRIAWRFLFRSRTTLAQKFFTVVSVLNVAVSVMLFLLIHSVMGGFAVSLESTLMGLEPPLVYRLAPGQARAELMQRFDIFAKQNPHWQFEAKWGAQFDGLVHVFDDPPLAARVRLLSRGLADVAGSKIKIYFLPDYDETQFGGDAQAILVGEKLYERLRFLPGDEERLTVLNPFADLGPSGEMEPGEAEYTVAGIVKSDFVPFDSSAILMSEAGFLRITKAALTPWRLDIFTPDPYQAQDIKRAWQDAFPTEGKNLSVWSDRNDNRLRALRLERFVFHLIFGMVLVIAGVNLAAVVQLAALSRKNDAALLEALGMKRSGLMVLHLAQGAILGILGAVLGVFFAWLVLFVQQHGFPIIPLAAYGDLILRLDFGAALVVLGLGPVLAVVLALIPATRRLPRETADILRGA